MKKGKVGGLEVSLLREENWSQQVKVSKGIQKNYNAF